MPNLLLSERDAALERFRATRSGRDKPSRYWKYDLEALDVPDRPAGGTVEFSAPGRATVVTLEAARRDHAETLARALGCALRPEHKFAHLTVANAGLGAFVHVPEGVDIEEPIVVTYRIGAGEAAYPYTVVLVERGARVTIVERVEAGAGAFVCGIAEIVSGESADVTYAAPQFAPEDARVLFTRAALPGRDARMTWATAEMGAALAVSDIATTIESPGVDANVATVFFPSGTQHVDIISSVDHRVGDAVSNTIVKSAAAGNGQGRYLGNIAIAAHAQHSNASLRDDALLLSKRAHIDSIPALEIAANDVKAYHGATVGALDEEVLFYMTSRGIDRREAERMITLGFFEPAIERFPTEALREELRTALAEKVQAS